MTKDEILQKAYAVVFGAHDGVRSFEQRVVYAHLRARAGVDQSQWVAGQDERALDFVEGKRAMFLEVEKRVGVKPPALDELINSLITEGADDNDR